MRQSFLPRELAEKTLRDMQPGEHGYVTPFTMSADQDGLLWLDLGATPRGRPMGTANMAIECVQGGFRVYSGTIGDYRYAPCALMTQTACVVGEIAFAPVELVHGFPPWEKRSKC